VSFALVPIVPSGLVFNAPALRSAINLAMDSIADGIKEDLAAHTDNWNAPPQWVIVSAGDRRDIITQDLIYRFQDKGTKAHVIMPKSARRLVFQVPGGTAFARKVNHPGNKAKNYTVLTAAAWQAKVAAVMHAYIAGVR
jgi:hypothetical protein